MATRTSKTSGACNERHRGRSLEDLVGGGVLVANVLDLLLVGRLLLGAQHALNLLVELLDRREALELENLVHRLELMVDGRVHSVKTVIGLALDGTNVDGQLLDAVGAVFVILRVEISTIDQFKRSRALHTRVDNAHYC